MKICFFLQRRWAVIGHTLACNLKKSFPDAEFCGLTYLRTSHEFLLNQKDVRYTYLLLEQDIHKKLYTEEIDHAYLQKIEKEYGVPNLWPFLYVDRVIMHEQGIREYPHDKQLLSYIDMMKLVQVTAKEVIKFLDNEKPDVIVFSIVGSIASTMLYHIAKKRGIKTMVIEHTRTGNRIAFTENYENFSWVKQRFDEISSGKTSPMKKEAELILSQFRSHPAPYLDIYTELSKQAKRMAHLQFLVPQKLLKSVYWHSKLLIRDIKKSKTPDYTDTYIWMEAWDRFMRKLRAVRGYDDLYGKIDLNERFAYFPLHYDPEVATMLYAPYYTDQIMVIKAIARSLPLDMKLYVKEHAPMIGYRRRNYYKQLKQIPNVCLVDASASSFDLIQNAEITVTITGTGGWEAVMLKKPVITMGEVFYNDVPGVKRCKGFEELPHLIKTQLEDWTHDEEGLVDYISALLEDSVPIDYMIIWEHSRSVKEVMENEDLAKLSKFLATKIEKLLQ